MTHRLDPLLRPRSVAVIGASVREDSMGDWVLRNLERSGFDGNVYPVNPGYDEVRGRECFSSISDLPEAPDLAIFAIGDHRLEASVDEAIAKGVRAAVIHSSLFLDVGFSPRFVWPARSTRHFYIPAESHVREYRIPRLVSR